MLTFLISSCEYFSLMSKKEWTEKSDNEKNVVIYIGGAFVVSTIERPCYWKNDNRHLIPGSSFGVGTNANAYSVFAYNDNLYIAGVDNESGANVRAWYWINNKKNYID